uniref:Uncharacterized protein n=1 Tax=Panagrolaimus sp. PS1159 TaxID=55785 RepID=A0AC35GZI1_9BILA
MYLILDNMLSNFDIQTVTEFSKNDKEIYGFLEANDGVFKNVLRLTLYGKQSKKEIGQIACFRDAFIEGFRNIFANSKLKALIFQIDGSPDNVEFIKTTKRLFALTQIPHVYFEKEEQMRSSILVTSNISLNVGDRIVEVLIDNDGYIVSELEYTDTGYVEREQRDCKPYKRMTAEKIRQRILGSNYFVKIICHANTPGFKPTKFLTKKVLNTVPLSKLMIMEEDLGKYNEAFVFETVKWMFDKSYVKFYVCQKSFRNYMIQFKYGDKYYPLILCKKHDIVPFNKVLTIPKSFLEFSHAYTGDNDVDVIVRDILNTPKEVHGLKFTYSIDESNFITAANVTGIVSKKISRLCEKLDSKELTIPVIGFYGELSFIYVKNDANTSGYKLLDTWNGKYGKDLYISFDGIKPKFFDDAVKTFESGSFSVVHDLIKIMSTPASKLSTLNPTLGYTISSDSEHPVLIHFKNYCGEKKAATPAFLMAMLLKEHLKELKGIFGEKPTEIGFCIFDDFDGDSEAKNRVENGLKESCQLLGGLKCSFFESL